MSIAGRGGSFVASLGVLGLVLGVSLGCGDDAVSGLGPGQPGDGGSDGGPDALPGDGGPDALPDAPPDAPPSPPLAELCGGEPRTLDEWESCYLKRWCETIVGCSSLNTFRDAAECVEWVDEVLDNRFTTDRLARRRAVAPLPPALPSAFFDEAAFTRCLADTSPSACNTARFSVACATRFEGTVADGGACHSDVECSSPGATCTASCRDACCLGTCQPKLALGQACDASDACQPGLVCHRTCLSGDVGSRCEEDGECDSGAWCNAGRCAADLPKDASCTRLAQCGGETTCVGLSVNSPAPGQCQRISRPGDRCDFACYGNLHCDATKTCRELPLLDQQCSTFLPCRGADTACVAGRCALRGGEGAECTAGQPPCQPGFFCTSELNDPSPKCTAARGLGASCARPGHCTSHLCSGADGGPLTCQAWPESCPADAASAAR